ncbi:MAG: FG-GAP-like repeat-containing protein [Phaeodactylibacter xiamenensis]|nr:FG-GAP-like repeat-containing protein [Phaeodactylibacter xiamenensis]MCR9053268.1 FG-GAP-like repeat-containing protein [bacterium]
MKSIWNTLLLLICFINIGNKSTEIEQDYELINNEIAGYTAGQFNVSDAGSAVYSIPITVPPGTAGMQPTLSLSYSSQGGNGLLGKGWHLQGMSVISRSRRTLAQDNQITGVNIDETDTYSLDGERLVLVEGNYGADNSEYRTEQNIHQKIKAYGNVNGSPERFKVWTKAGLVIEYGFTTDSKIEAQGSQNILFWYVSRIFDTMGNYISFSYQEENATGDYRPHRIDYTLNENGNLSATSSIQFIYEDREDKNIKFASGVQMQAKKRLNRIECKHDDEVVRAYHFEYDYSTNTNISLLTKITECGTDGICFSPTTFEWMKENNLGFSNSTSDALLPASLDNDNLTLLTGDWDGDGISDFLTFDPISGNNAFFNNNKSFNFSLPSNAILPANNIKGKIPRVADFNADGFSDLLFYDPNAGDNIWYFNDGQSFSQLSFSDESQLIPKAEFQVVNGTQIIQPYFGDYNGDGLTDVMLYLFSNGRNHFFFNQKQGTATTFTSVNNGQNVISGSQLIGGTDVQLISGDWNADGLMDLLRYQRGNGSNRWFINTGNGVGASFTSYTDQVNSAIAGDANVQIQFGDWNADGLTDLMWFNKNGGATKWFFNSGKFAGSQQAFTQVSHTLNNNLISGTGNSKVLYLFDFNGDGADDILWYNKDNGYNHWFQNDGQCNFNEPLNPAQPSQQGFLNPIDPNQIKEGTNISIGGFSCQGLVDIMWYDKSNGANRWFQSNIEIANYIEKITNGHGLEIELTYKSLLDGSIYTKENTAIYPEYDFQSNLFVISSFSTDNGIGGKSHVSYCYKGAKTNLQGRGFRGFSEVRTIDLGTGITNIKFFDRDFKYLSSPLTRTETRLPNGNILNETDYTNELTEYYGQDGSVKAHFSYTSKTVTRNYELDGTLITTVTNRMSYDDYGNVRYAVVDHGDGHIDSTWNEYTDVIGNWILGRLSRSEVFRKAPQKPITKRVAAFEYHPTTGLLINEITEPDLPIEQRISKHYTYDEFGNITQSTLTYFNGTQLTSRNTYTTFDQHGRFTLSVSNELGHTSTSAYDQKFGNLTASTDANGHTISYEYDEFGRVSRVEYPDGNWTTTQYLKCEGNCPVNAVFYTVSETATSPPAYTYIDILGREIQKSFIGFNGQTTIVKSTYNERGLITGVSDPYFEGSTPVWTTSNYDEIGRTVQTVSPGNLTTTIEYLGLATISTNSLGQTKTLTQNPIGRLASSTDNQGNTITYEYDSQGNMVKITDPLGNETTMTYDLYGNKTSMTDPDLGTYQYHYNTIGELLSQTNQKGEVVLFNYDILGRLIERAEPEGVTSWNYDSQPNGLGMLASTTSPGYYYELIYDDLSRVRHQDRTINGKIHRISNYFDEFGRLLSTHYPNSFSIRNIYNDYGYHSEVRDNITNTLYWKADQVNARGQLTKSTLGNGVISEFSFNNNTSWLEKIKSFGTQGQVQDLSYAYNNLGNLTQRQDNLLNLIESFEYDDLNRLVSSSIPGVANTNLTYDVLGNITYKSDVGQYFYGENGAGPHQLTTIIGDTTLCLPSNTSNYSFTSFDKVNTIFNEKGDWLEIDYGASRERIIQRTFQDSILSATKIYVGGLFEQLITDSLTLDLCYISANGEVVAVRNSNHEGETSTHYWHKDHLGSLQSITGDSGQVIALLSYDAWGKRRSPDGTDIDNNLEFDYDRGYTGHEHLDNFGLINMNGRVYDPVIGRFISPDPFIQDHTDLQNLNRYSYVMNNPLAYTDPSGFFFKKVWRSLKRSFNRISRNGKKAVRSLSKGEIGDALNSLGQAGIDLSLANLKASNVAGQTVFGKETWNQIVVTAASIGVSIVTAPAGPVVSGAASGFTSSSLSVMLAGGSTNDAFHAGLRGAAIGAVTAALTHSIGEAWDHKTTWGNVAQKSIAHGVVQGAATEAQGGKFEHGFLSGSFSSASQIGITYIDDPIVRVASSAVVGGTSAELGGGKFSNGAISGAFVSLYNEEGNLWEKWTGGEDVVNVSFSYTTENFQSNYGISGSISVSDNGSFEASVGNPYFKLCTSGKISGSLPVGPGKVGAHMNIKAGTVGVHGDVGPASVSIDVKPRVIIKGMEGFYNDLERNIEYKIMNGYSF